MKGLRPEKTKTGPGVMNSAAGLYVAEKVESFRDGVSLAAEIIDSGKALKQLEKFIEVTNR